MTQLLIGDPGCTFEEVAQIFEEPSVSTLKITWWTTLAMLLDIPAELTKKWKLDLLHEKHGHSDVILELLTQWRMIKSEDATLGALYEAIPTDKKQFKALLQTKIRKKAKYWKELDSDSQNVVLQTNVSFLGRNSTLSSIKHLMSDDKFNKIINKTEMNEFFLKTFINEDWDFGHYDIPKPLPYYIHRKLILKRRLNPAIFKHKCSDIFVIEGIQHHHLSILARPELTDVSSDQLNKVTRRFILLEHPEHYNEIVKVAKNPVHRIKHQDDQFYWLSTSGSCRIIRVFLTNDAEEIEEKTLIKDRLVTFNNRPIAICSSPGMGKSVLLANLAHEMIKTYPQRITIYLKLRSLIQKLSLKGPIVAFENIKQILVSSSSISLIGKEILFEFLDKNDMAFEIFLDGFDEITLDCMKTAKHFLKYLLKCTNMRVYITSRPHMQSDIENALEVISLNILPFNQDNQVKFLQNVWTLNANIAMCEKLSQFAVNVLKSLEFINQSNTSQTEFAGIPLQCFMLAQVYAKSAEIYSTIDHFNFQATNSLFDLYEKFINLKFQNIEKRDRNLVKLYHWKEALLLLFPDNPEAAQIVQALTRSIKTKRVPWNKIFTVGILEYAPDKPNFVHRTFAEYLLAEFIVGKLLNNYIVDINISLEFILDCVLSIHKTTKGHIFSGDDISRAIDFIKSSESWLTEKLDLKKLKTVLLSNFDYPLEAVENDLSVILMMWYVDAGANASVDLLDRAFDFLDCNQVVEDLHKNVFQASRVFQNEMLCTFLDTTLEKYKPTLASRKLTHCKNDKENLTRECDRLKWKLLKSTEHGYEFLTQTLLELYNETSIINKVLKLDYRFCKRLLIGASLSDNVNFFQFICNTIKSFSKFNLDNFLNKFDPLNLMLGLSPLSVSISRGNYKLVEYLINIVGDDIKEWNGLYLACFFNSWNDARNVVVNKVKLLKLLRSLEVGFQIETLEMVFPKGVNVELLIVQYDLYDYVPSEKDVAYMISSVSLCCKNCADIDYMLNWLLSKNLAHLLTLRRNNDCLLSAAVAGNVLAPKTLSMVYKECSFLLGKIFISAVLCKRSDAIVKNIIELSNDVNLVDDNKNTLLHWAACYRKIKLIKYLLSIGANVNFRNIFGNIPLYNVFQYKEATEDYHLIHDIVNLFVDNNADVCIKNIAGISALDLAKVHRDKMCIEDKTLEMLEGTAHHNSFLESGCIDINENLKDILINYNDFSFFSMFLDSITCKCSLTFVKNMLKISGNVNLSGSSKNTLLHFSVLFGDLQAIEFLLINGANANLKDRYGQTPLYGIFGCDMRNQFEVLIKLNTNTQWIHECVQLLLEYNADVSVKDNNGKTPLDLAQKLKNTLNIEDRTIKLLVERFQRENEID